MNYNLFIENRIKQDENEYIKQAQENELNILLKQEQEKPLLIKRVLNREGQENQRVSGGLYKFCSYCQITKEFEKDFYNNVSRSDGKSHLCKTCCDIFTQKWDEENKGKVKAWHKKYQNKKLYHGGTVNFINVLKEALLLA
jgi:hypothetical protein